MMLSFINPEHRSGARFVSAPLPARKTGVSNAAEFVRTPLLNAATQSANPFFRADHAAAAAPQPPNYEAAAMKSVQTLRRQYSQSSDQSGRSLDGAQSNAPTILLRLLNRLKSIANDMSDPSLGASAPLVLEQHEYAAALKQGRSHEPASPKTIAPKPSGEILTAENLSRHNSPQQSGGLLERAAAAEHAQASEPEPEPAVAATESELLFDDAELLNASQAHSGRTSRARSRAGSHDLNFELLSAGSSVAPDDAAFVATRTLARRRMQSISVWQLLTGQDPLPLSTHTAFAAPMNEGRQVAANDDPWVATPLELEFGSFEHAEPIVTSVYFEARVSRPHSAASSVLSEDDVDEKIRTAAALITHLTNNSAALGTE